MGELKQPRDAVPVLAELCSIPIDAPYHAPDLDPAARRERTLQVLEASVVALSEHQPLLIIFEDLHWADATTLELLDRIVDRVRAVPVLLLMTARPTFVAPWDGEGACEHHRSASTQRRADRGHGRKGAGESHATRRVARANRVETDGVPLFVEELTKTVLEAHRDKTRTAREGQTPFEDVPDTLRDSLMARLDRLGPGMEVAQLAAALGRMFSYEMIADLASMDEGALREVLARLTDAELIHRRGVPPRAEYTFKHALVQDVAYSSMLRSRRQELHKRIARHLETHYPARVESEPELLAHHYSRARETAPAIVYFLRAAQSNVCRSAYPEAMSTAMEGLRLLSQHPEGPENTRLEMQLQLARAVAAQATRGLAAADTGAAYARARALCADVGAAGDVFPVLHGIYLFHLLRGESDTALDVARACLRRAQRETTTLFHVIGHRLVGSSLYVRGELNEAHDQLQAALQRYDPVRHATEETASLYGVDQKTIALAHCALVSFLMGFPRRAEETARQSLMHAESLGSSHNLGYALFWLNLMELLWRRPEGVPERAERLRDLGLRHRQPTWTSLGTYQLGAAHEALGGPGAGIEQIRCGLTDWRAIGCGWLTPTMLASLATAHARMGERPRALGLLEEAQVITDRSHQWWYEPELRRLTGELLLRDKGAERQAERCFEQALSLAKRQRAKTWELRAGIALARLRRRRDGPGAVTGLLGPLLDWFSEGHDLPEVQEAHRLVEGPDTR